MDYDAITNQTSEQGHKKARWIIIFIACLIALVALVTVFKGKIDPKSTMTEEERMIKATSAKSVVPIDANEEKKLIDATTAGAKKTNTLSEEDAKKLIDATSAK